MTSQTSAPRNPLLSDWTGAAFALPPFGAIAPEHFRPAFERALAAHRAEIDGIAAGAGAPTFVNTIEALERSGQELDRVGSVFSVLASAHTGDALEAVEREVSPLLARHSNALYLDRALYARIAALYERRATLGLSPEQARVLDRYHTRFVRAGAALEKPAQDRLAAINERLASLGTQFGQNVLADEKAYALILDEVDLDGLPDFARAAAAAAAQERGESGKYAIDRDALQALVAKEGGNFALAPWDWRYYAEKLRQAKANFDDAAIKPYLALDHMIEAAFDCATGCSA
jgi:peptidyl-dipeptidase Dcp